MRNQNQVQTTHKTGDSARAKSVRSSRHSKPRFSHPVLQLQQQFGNQAVQRLLNSRRIQAKLTIGRPDDKYEQEADRVADQVMRMHEPAIAEQSHDNLSVQNPSIQRVCPECEDELKRQPADEIEEEEELLQRQPVEGEEEEEEELLQTRPMAGQTPAVTNELESSINALRGGGQPLSNSVRDYMEPRFGRDFSQVRVHADTRAANVTRSINARAFTRGKDIVFGKGEYSPETAKGRYLLSHELTHVVQQSSAGARLQRAPTETNTYTVKPGESLQALSVKLGLSIAELVAANADKLKTWKTAGGGEIKGFNAGEIIIIPTAKKKAEQAQPTAEGERGVKDTLMELGGMVAKAVKDVWAWLTDSGSSPTDTAASTTEPKQATTKKAEPKDPIEVIELHNAAGTFGTNPVRVTSTVRNPQKQLDILRYYCKQNKTTLNSYVESVDWLKGELDWDVFNTCGLADKEVWLPFFFALYYGGGGPGTKSSDRTLPLVASPVQSRWKDRNANASPHLAGRAMDVKDGNLEKVAKTIKTKIPEFNKNTGKFPVRSTQIEKVSGQKLVHINFKVPVFPTSAAKKSEDKGTL